MPDKVILKSLNDTFNNDSVEQTVRDWFKKRPQAKEADYSYEKEQGSPAPSPNPKKAPALGNTTDPDAPFYRGPSREGLAKKMVDSGNY